MVDLPLYLNRLFVRPTTVMGFKPKMTLGLEHTRKYNDLMDTKKCQPHNREIPVIADVVVLL
jgi:hypothetical protein